MAILPGYDNPYLSMILSEEQLKWTAAFQYMSAILIIATTIFWIINFYRIIITAKKYRVLPLLTFYILALPLLVFRFYDVIWFFPVLIESQLVP